MYKIDIGMPNLTTIAKVEHIVTGLNSVKFAVYLPDIYESIGTIVGIAKSTGTDDSTAIHTNEKSLIAEGNAVRLRCSYKGTDGKTHQSFILCSLNNVSAGINGLKGKTLASGETVISARFPRRRRLG